MKTVNYYSFEELSEENQNNVYEKYKDFLNKNDLGIDTLDDLIKNKFLYYLEQLFGDEVEISNTFTISGRIKCVIKFLTSQVVLPESLEKLFNELKNDFPIKETYYFNLETSRYLKYVKVEKNETIISNVDFHSLYSNCFNKFFRTLTLLMNQEYFDLKELCEKKEYMCD
jgi:hypothetical protein